MKKKSSGHRTKQSPQNPIQTIGFVSLGCPKNLVDSEKMLGLLAEDGLAITNDPSAADAIVINTCGFLQAAKEESIQAIREAAAHKRTGRCKRIIVAGCLAQRYQSKLLEEVPEIDSLVGVFNRQSIVSAVRGGNEAETARPHFLGKYHQLKSLDKIVTLEADQGRLRLTPRHYAYLRISEGCNQGCAFCTIPSIRGPMRSKPIDRILSEATELAADGCHELLLIGQDTTSYGQDIGYTPGLSGLLQTLDRELTTIPWVRLMYAYPSCFTDEMIAALAESGRILKYIDMPLQHINDQMLKVMRRRVTRKQTQRLLDKLRKSIPGITIRTTFIAGSPGETDAQHRELVQFIKDFRFDMLGVFPYSPEPGTAMARLQDQLSNDLTQARVQEIMLAQQEIAFANARAMEGRTIRVLVDRPADADADEFVARSAAQAPEVDSVTLVQSRKVAVGKFLDVKVTGAQGYDLLAKPAASNTQRLPVISKS